ncbi:MAG: phenylalanine--tRNA ligase subunit alpha [Candidatus Magasanikbacteria bacterium RIFCSPHIGHO2_01_FULL_33_34]|uniref:Phenylalanine--tRNA ligase alpha subunit n=1 Tax=Candidatus Magasanikbacteria bacterium RIFCSPHIGHO2_01_FULL_33_34 TaxID=1798671 RepID=A0A1F6LKV9_9BACT|nr:MAG: phenylalanine--tRNA ligase subunit alpha [Candidatus Magasanikbacteria bacterium RIFCSPHIGHO2_01_FULL_33_34]OGH65710.1 MAG: phenylalanine--tRNA ligase subunit alpha [Candidatus Magasanikbacteria bacterium RIFCSPHIGHO2_02_FULL_33_17]OGH76323.1 MAG: phenylalanine--tRNA ligase subunit alpha [Candidatus Magasanikbacteria bacterium RIFCSPLOWO2_01_FULL_33_34]
MQDYLQIKEKFNSQINSVQDLNSLELLEQEYFSRKAGEITLLMRGLGDVPEEERKEKGQKINELKVAMVQSIESKRLELKENEYKKIIETESIDITQPNLPKHESGHLHPITLVQNQLEDLFTSMGFAIEDGPELESEYYNFTALNIPETHPARDTQDTFYIKDHAGWVMRTHTSSMQVRAMQSNDLPMRVIMPGRCYRNESTDARHEHTFYQLEGFVVDENISFANLKGILEVVAKNLYGPEAKIRLRPKFYPFVEPGVNGEVSCFLCESKGCRVCKQSGWLEIFGAGMIHPNVLSAGGIDAQKYQGFAFGLGLDRLVMLKYGIEDIRHFQGGDLRFLKQF